MIHEPALDPSESNVPGPHKSFYPSSPIPDGWWTETGTAMIIIYGFNVLESSNVHPSSIPSLPLPPHLVMGLLAG